MLLYHCFYPTAQNFQIRRHVSDIVQRNIWQQIASFQVFEKTLNT